MSTRVKLDDDELALILEAIRFQRHSAEDERGKKNKELKEFIKFCKKLEKKIEKFLEEEPDKTLDVSPLSLYTREIT